MHADALRVRHPQVLVAFARCFCWLQQAPQLPQATDVIDVAGPKGPAGHRGPAGSAGPAGVPWSWPGDVIARSGALVRYDGFGPSQAKTK